PEVNLLNSSGELISKSGSAISETIELLKQGKVIALKGLGGYQLIAEAYNYRAVSLLRQRKNREEKPFAIMAKDISMADDLCEINELEKRLLCSPESPVVLLKKKKGKNELESAAPGNPYLGIMLPYTPLHHLILRGIDAPVIATSGNISEEPMCINETEAFKKLNKIADYFLVHNRGIIRAVDDSVARVVKGREMIIRRARGYAPLPFQTNKKSKTFIALGANLKNTFSMKKGNNIFVSQHLGDLENKETEDYLRKTIKDFTDIYNIEPDYIIHDLHPEYATTGIAKEFNKETISVQHHYAHAAACYYENQVQGNCLSVCWDGTGYGTDGTIWGGEFLLYDGKEIKPAAQFKQFTIPGGGQAIKDIKRSAAGILFDIYGENTLRKIKRLNFIPDADNIITFLQLLEKNINCFKTSSAGRLIDAVSFLLKASSYSHFEGEAAMQLEFLAAPGIKDSYPFHINKNEILIIDWHPVIENLLVDIKEEVPPGNISAKFHNTLLNIITTAALIINEKKVILTGGCFQNMYLLNGAIDKLKEKNFNPYWHQRIPTNDGGISFGQAAYAAAILDNS
ncbi:MAG: carbamoyltransferase HypF, partial [Ignavibacteriales bacterium]